MKKIPLLTLVLSMLILAPVCGASMPNPVLPSNTPTVTSVTYTTASVSVPEDMWAILSPEQRSALYFEYYETQQVCIMIYPTPENCLPKKTQKGLSSINITNLKPSTSYTVSYKVDNTIACITTPCPENGLQSGYTEFTTQQPGMGLVYFHNNLRLGSRGNDVVMLQNVLRNQGYFLYHTSTGYFGTVTLKAVRAFQKDYNIIQTGFVGPLTRGALNNPGNVPVNTEQFFSGIIQAVSTACYADGECSVTIDGKKVVTTIGWSQAVVGSIRGTVNSIGDIQTNKIGARAKVYAKKTVDGYTLYGNSAYYIEVF